MTVHLKRKPFTVEEYYKMAEIGILDYSENIELIGGELFIKEPKTPRHASMVDQLTTFLITNLHKKVIVSNQNPVRLSNIDEPEPDISILKLKPDYYRSHHPTPKDIYIVIEVADSTLEKDHEVKAELYAKAAIPENWIINIPDRQIEIYRQPKNGDYHFKQIISEPTLIKSETIDLSIQYTDVYK